MWRSVDLVLRFIYVAAAPIMLIPAAAVFPIGGVMIGAAIAMVVAVFGGEGWRERVARIPVIGKALGGMAALGEFYRAHPAKPLPYYIVYPALFPYWLINRTARREFLLYRKLNALAVVLIAGGAVIDYVRNWRPEIGVGYFIGASIGVFVLQLVATFAIAMPIVTTVLALHQRARRKTLIALVGLSIATASFGAFATHRMHAIGMVAQIRLNARTAVAHARFERCVADTHDRSGCRRYDGSAVALAHALDAANQSLNEVAGDGVRALDRARETLATYYRADEASAFHLYGQHGVVMLFVRFRRQPPIWLARDAHRIIDDPARLPAEAREVLGL